MADQDLVIIPKLKNTIGLGVSTLRDTNLYGPGENIKMPRATAEKLGLKYVEVGSAKASGEDGEDGGEDGDGYDGMTKAELEAELEARNSDLPEDEQIEVEGTGANGGVLKEDLIKALRADDEANRDEE